MSLFFIYYKYTENWQGYRICYKYLLLICYIFNIENPYFSKNKITIWRLFFKHGLGIYLAL